MATLFAAVVTLVLSVQVFGQASGAAPEPENTIPLNSPSTDAPEASPSPTPAGGKEKDAVLQAVSDVAKAALEASKVTMEQTAAFYQQSAEQGNHFFTNAVSLIGGFVTVVSFLIGFFGIKSIAQLRKDTVQKYDDIARDFSKQLEDRCDSIMAQIQVKADNTLEDTRRAIEAKMDDWTNPAAVAAVGPTEGADIKRFVDAGDFEGLYRKIELNKDSELKAAQYREVATTCMNYDDRFRSFEAANKYRECLGQTPKAEQFLGYVYWWFKDIDTAIVHTDNALQLALNLPPQEINKDKSIVNRIKNNLAFYFAQKQINKPGAVSIVKEILANTSPEDKYYLHHIDTAGTVYLKFAANGSEVDKAIQYFLQVLAIEPQSKTAQEGLIDAFEKKKSFKK